MRIIVAILISAFILHPSSFILSAQTTPARPIHIYRPAGLIGEWNAIGVADGSGQGRDITLKGGATYSTTPISQQQCFSLVTANTDYLVVSNAFSQIASNNTVTVAGWFKITSVPVPGPVLIELGNITLLSCGVQYFSATSMAVWRGGSYRIYSALPILTNQTRFIAMTFTNSGNSALFYVDGVLQTNYTGTVASMPTNSTGYFIFGNYPTGSPGMVGFIDGLQVYNRTLSADEIMRLYTEYHP